MSARGADVSALIEDRLAAQLTGSFRRALVAAVVVHVAVGLASWLVPKWTAPKRQPIDYVSVTIVPAAKLGVERPKPAPPAPEPKKSEPVPQPKPATKAPVLPTAKPKQAAKPVAPPAPEPAEQGSKQGALAGMALGAPVAQLDNPDFTYGYYVDQMLAQISRNWIRPPVGGGIEAWLHYRIQRDGTITDVELVRPSGIASFDLAAMRAVQSSSPLPPLPRAYRDSTLGVNLIVR